MHAVKNGTWGPWQPRWMWGASLEGSTVGIIGLGHIGMAVARCLQPFYVKRIIYTASTPLAQAKVGAEFLSFDDILALSDVVLVCVSLNLETTGMFNANLFQRMKRTVVFINVSGGGVVNHDDLYLALTTGHIAAAGLDVTMREPLLTDSPLLTLDNCIVLPHIGSATHTAREAMAEMAAMRDDDTMPGEIHTSG
ncbi:hypothetical protein ACOMHN_035952 [Nucella lapillus]